MEHVTLEKTRNYLILKIPLKSVKTGKKGTSLGGRKVIDEAIREGLYDIDKGRVFGPFKSVKEFRAALGESE